MQSPGKWYSLTKGLGSVCCKERDAHLVNALTSTVGTEPEVACLHTSDKGLFTPTHTHNPQNGGGGAVPVSQTLRYEILCL